MCPNGRVDKRGVVLANSKRLITLALTEVNSDGHLSSVIITSVLPFCAHTSEESSKCFVRERPLTAEIPLTSFPS